MPCGIQDLKSWVELSFGIGLEVVGTAVSAAIRTPLEKTSTDEFVTGRIYVFVIRVNIVSGVAQQVLEVLCFLQDRLKSVLRQHWSLSFAGFC